MLNNQNGKADSTLTDFVHGERSTGPHSLTPEELKANRLDYIDNVRAHPLLDDWYKPRSADLSQIDVPALIVSNWGGLGLHLRGTIEGFLGIAATEKWLKVQTGPYFATFVAPDSVALQRRFFDRYLKGIENGWENEPRVDVTVRAPGDKVDRHITSTAWPIDGTPFVKDASRCSAEEPRLARARGRYQHHLSRVERSVAFSSAPLDRDMEIAGPLLAKLRLSCSKPDMDMFCTVLAFDPSGAEINFATNFEPIPVSRGWLRVALRKLDAKRSSTWQPVHSFDEVQPLKPGEIVEAQIEVWPTAVFLPKGSRLALILSGQDYRGTGQPARLVDIREFPPQRPDRPPARPI